MRLAKHKKKVYYVQWFDDWKKESNGKLPAVGNRVDLKTAKYTNDIGVEAFGGVFEDPDFDPSQSEFYCARVIEIPTPRWTLRDAIRFNVKIYPEVPMVIQERAVSSTILYNPN